MFLVSFFLQLNAGGRKKKHKVPEKTQNFSAIQTLLALGAYSYERTHISFTVLDKPPNIKAGPPCSIDFSS